MNAGVVTAILGTTLLYSSGQDQVKKIDLATPDAHRLKTGQFTYKDSSAGKELGTSKIKIEKDLDSGNYQFSMQSSGYLDQRWEAIAGPSFEPVSAKIRFGEAPPYFDLTYASGKVTGFVTSRSTTGPKRSVDATVSPGTVDQRIDWAAVLSNDLQPGQRFQFSVYDPGIGTSHVLAVVSPLEQVHVPAGSFPVFRVIYRIEKATGTEQYVVFATESLPRMMVREDFPDGTTSELVEMSK
jgi:hypothetical protein